MPPTEERYMRTDVAVTDVVVDGDVLRKPASWRRMSWDASRRRGAACCHNATAE
jgi:hypothetical protein